VESQLAVKIQGQKRYGIKANLKLLNTEDKNTHTHTHINAIKVITYF